MTSESTSSASADTQNNYDRNKSLEELLSDYPREHLVFTEEDIDRDTDSPRGRELI